MSNGDRNSKDIDATEDDDFGDFEGPEDDAPESVQAIAGPPNWVFPDLLRVQTNQSSHDDTESSSKSSSKISAQPRVSMSRQMEASIGGAIGRETGAIPKQRALDPPDVSLLTNTSQPKLPSTLDLCSSALRSSSSTYARDVSNIPSAISGAQLVTSPLSRQSNLLIAPDVSASHTNGVDMTQSRVSQLERDLKALQTQKAVLQQQLLQKDTQIRELNAQSRQSVPNIISVKTEDSVIAALSESLAKFRSSIEASMKQLEDRLVSMETRLPSLITSALETSLLSRPLESSESVSTSSATPNRSLMNLIDQQKKELENERRQYLLMFSELLKNAGESIQNRIDVNGLKSVPK